jgi:hypothetical protein
MYIMEDTTLETRHRWENNIEMDLGKGGVES